MLQFLILAVACVVARTGFVAITKSEFAVSGTHRLTGIAGRTMGFILVYVAVGIAWFGLFGIPLLLENDFVFMPGLRSKHLVPYVLVTIGATLLSGAFTSRVIFSFEETQLSWGLAPAFGITWWMALVVIYHFWASMCVDRLQRRE